MFTICLGLATIRWTQWVQINSTLSTYGLVTLGIGVIACCAFWIFTNDDGKSVPSAAPSLIKQKVEAPSTSSATSTGNIVNIYPPTAPAISLPPADPPLDVARVPELSLKVGWGTIEEAEYKFEFAKIGGRRAYILELINTPAPAHGVTYPARSIVARITFECGAKHLFIDRAFWMGKEENEIDLDVGRTAQVLVGIVKGTQWTLFENPNAIPFHMMEWNAYHQTPAIREFPDMGSEPIVIQIHIISVADRNQSRTLLHKRILVEYVEESGLKQVKTRFF